MKIDVIQTQFTSNVSTLPQQPPPIVKNSVMTKKWLSRPIFGIHRLSIACPLSLIITQIRWTEGIKVDETRCRSSQ
ncbi:hypothetical protein B566_EDAN004479 [Ephemera danica]|nr:hypothetical protein B566_EDAN004479 [Ephemera danica]